MSGRMGKGIPVHAQTKTVIINVLEYMKTEAELGPLNVSAIMKRVSQATGITRGALRRIIKENEAVKRGEKPCFDSPSERRPKIKTKVNIASSDKEAIRRLVHTYHTTHKKMPTLRGILQEIRQNKEINFTGNHETLRKILINLGFKWTKCGDNRKPSWQNASQSSQICETSVYSPFFINIKEENDMEEYYFEGDEDEMTEPEEGEEETANVISDPLMIGESPQLLCQPAYVLTNGAAVSSANHSLPSTVSTPKASTPVSDQGDLVHVKQENYLIISDDDDPTHMKQDDDDMISDESASTLGDIQEASDTCAQ